MKLPGAESATIAPAKIRDYLLAPEHPVGRFKAVFFVALGYSRRNWRRLQRDLLLSLGTGRMLPGKASQFGQK